MAEKSDRTRIVAVVEPGATQQQITAALGSQPDFQLLDILPSTDKAAQEIRAVGPQIILVDHQLGGQPTLDILDDLALQFPEMAVVAILPGSDPLTAQQVMLAGARAFIVQPFTQVNLLSTLRRVRDLESRRQFSLAPTTAAVDSVKPLHTVAVYGPRGGVGTSTVAINLAVALRGGTDRRVLLLEGKMLFGHLGLMLNIRSPNSLADIIPHVHTLEESMVRDVVAEHVSGVHVLLSPTSPEVAQGVRPEALFNVVSGLRPLYEFLVIDAGSYLNDNTVTLLDSADRVLLVTTPDLAALHDTSRFVQLSRTLDFPPGKLCVILNRASLEGGVRTKDIEKALHQDLFAQIPDDGPSALRSVNRGIPLLMKYPRSPASRAIRKLATTLAEVGAGQAAHAAGPAQGGVRQKRRLASAPASKAAAT